MRGLPPVSVLLLALALALAAPACGGEEPQVFGDEVDVAAVSEAASPVSAVGEADGRREVTVSGTLGRVCQTMGCWFYLADEDDMILIDLEMGRRFTVPKDSQGRRAVVVGDLVVEGGDRRIVARSAVLWP